MATPIKFHASDETLAIIDTRGSASAVVNAGLQRLDALCRELELVARAQFTPRQLVTLREALKAANGRPLSFDPAPLSRIVEQTGGADLAARFRALAPALQLALLDHADRYWQAVADDEAGYENPA